MVLRGKAYAWTPVLGSFDKLHEVGLLSYLVYFRFKCFVDDSVGLSLERPFDWSQNLGSKWEKF